MQFLWRKSRPPRQDSITYCWSEPCVLNTQVSVRNGQTRTHQGTATSASGPHARLWPPLSFSPEQTPSLGPLSGPCSPGRRSWSPRPCAVLCLILRRPCDLPHEEAPSLKVLRVVLGPGVDPQVKSPSQLAPPHPYSPQRSRPGEGAGGGGGEEAAFPQPCVSGERL